MHIDVYHNPLKESDRQPYGALKVNGRMFLSLRVLRYYDVREAYIVINKDGEQEVYYPIKWTEHDCGYDRFSGEVSVTSTGLYFYRFEVRSPSGIFSIGAGNGQQAQWKSTHKWAVTVYRREYDSPEWMKNGVIYQIFPDRFNVGGEVLKTKDYAVYHENWDEEPVFLPNEHGEIVNNDFFGGNLKGITEKLDYLQSLNVSCIYLNPIFDAYSNHKYDTGNYAEIDSGFGTEEDLSDLIAEAGRRNIKIILDGVFNHTGSDSCYFNKLGRYKSVGAYQSKNSPYYKWFTFRHYPDKYDGWWGITTLPAVREDEPSYDSYINGMGGIIEKWMKKGLGGFRLDVVDELPDVFLDNLVNRVKSVSKDAVVIGEVWENAATKTAYSVRRRYFQGRQLDSVMNYPFQKAIVSFILRGESARLSEAIISVISSYPKEVIDVLMNLLSTHDTERAITLLGGEESYRLTKTEKASTNIAPDKMPLAIKRLKLAALLLYTLPGIPSIYYADEAGQEGYGDPFCRRTYPWGRENKELLDYYRMLGGLRKLKAIQEGNIKIEYADTGEFVFSRYAEEDQLYIAANSLDMPMKYKIEGELTDILTGEKFCDTVVIEPLSARILSK